MKYFWFVLGLLACTSTIQARPEEWLEGGLITPEMVASVRQELDLTSDQESKMNALVIEVKEKGEPLEKAMREEQKKLARLLRMPDSSSDQADAALSRLLEAEAAVKHLRLNTLLKLRDMLTAEQQKRAASLSPGRQGKANSELAQIREKARRLKGALDKLGVPPTRAMQERGDAVEALVRQGNLETANQALDQLIRDSQIDESPAEGQIHFAQFDPGDTGIESLKQRYLAVEEKAQSVVSVALVRQLLQGKEALEAAKSAEDPITVGRILTWAETVLK